MINAELVREGVKLILFNPSTNKWAEMVDRKYQSYFFLPHPVSPNDQENLEKLDATVKVAEKRDLFTDQSRQLTKVELKEAADPMQASAMFDKSWEGTIPSILSYVYDHDLIFGTQHRIHENQIQMMCQIPERTRQHFEDLFSEVREMDPNKYDLLERWFTLCSQPVPQISPVKLGIRGKVDLEKYYLAFMLSRIANLPVPQAYTSQQVSTWIKSILHHHLRRNNILIPTSRELRRDEPLRRVRGALTFPPKSGLYFNTVVTDFESLYPSLIDAYNLSYETINCPHTKCRDNKVPELEYHACTQRRGVYSVLIGALKDLRIHWYKPLARDKTLSIGERQLAQATSQLLKLILVSSYGVTIRIHGLAQPSLAESITAYGRYSLQTTWDLAQENGLHPLYGDTDSLFLDNPSTEQVKGLIRTVKEQIRLDLALEERYAVCILPRAMKAYFGIRKDGTADIKGVTAIKSNSPHFIQKIFRDCVNEMANVRNRTDLAEAMERIQDLFQHAVKNLRAGRVPMRDLEYQVELHDDPTEKMGETTLHQPYQCAIQLIDTGKPVHKGDVVRFIKVKPFSYGERTFTVKPIEHIWNISEVNVEDYVRNLRTALNQTFKPMNLQFKEEATKKITLSDFL